MIQIHEAHVFLLNYVQYMKEPDEIYATKHAELSAYNAELRGLAFAIGDKELLNLVNESYSFIHYSPADRSVVGDEMEIRGKSQKLHTRISQLIKDTAQ